MRETLQRQFKTRSAKLSEAGTGAFRALDGDLTIDVFGEHWLASGEAPDPPEALLAPLEGGRSLSWKRLDQHEKEVAVPVWGTPPAGPFLVEENGLQYEIDFAAGYSQGLFLDQRESRASVRERSSGKRILNLFSYTCAFSVSAAAGGATTTSLDLSGRYLDWGKRNMKANGIDPEDHYFCKGDAFEWLARFKKSGRLFQGVILDPPTFSRGGKRKVFRAEDDYGELVRLCADVLEPGGWLLATTNCRRLNSCDFRMQVEDGLAEASRDGVVSVRPMPFDFDRSDYLKTLFVELG